MALALRAAQTDTSQMDAMWSAAFNLGLREVGAAGAAEEFDPLRHEDIRGGLLRGAPARIVRCGWSIGARLLLRAQVEPPQVSSP